MICPRCKAVMSVATETEGREKRVVLVCNRCGYERLKERWRSYPSQRQTTISDPDYEQD